MLANYTALTTGNVELQPQPCPSRSISIRAKQFIVALASLLSLGTVVQDLATTSVPVQAR